MAQIGYPTTNVTQTNFTGGVAEIDEASPSDADWAYSTNNTDGVLEVSLGTLNDPLSSTGHQFAYRVAKIDSDAAPAVIDGTGVSITLIAELWQGTTLIASDTERTLDGTWTTYTKVLSSAQADAITDYTDLRIRINVTGNTGGPVGDRRGAGVSWAQFETPDAVNVVSGDAAIAAVASVPSPTAIATLYSSGTVASSASVPATAAVVTSFGTAALAAVALVAATAAEGNSNLNSVYGHARGGPVYLNSAWYRFDLDPSNRKKLRAQKATTAVDGTYSAVSSLTPPTLTLTEDEIIAFDVHRGDYDTKIHCAIAVGDTAQNASVYYCAFDPVTDTWGTPEIIVDNVTYTTSASASKVVSFPLGVSQSNIGDILIVHATALNAGEAQTARSFYDLSTTTWTKGVLNGTENISSIGSTGQHSNGTAFVGNCVTGANKERLMYTQLTTADPPVASTGNTSLGPNAYQAIAVAGIRQYVESGNFRYAAWTWFSENNGLVLAGTSSRADGPAGVYPKMDVTHDIKGCQAAGFYDDDNTKIRLVFQHTDNSGLWYCIGGLISAQTYITKFAKLSSDTTIIPKDAWWDATKNQFAVLYDTGTGYDIAVFNDPVFVESTATVAATGAVVIQGTATSSALASVTSSGGVTVLGVGTSAAVASVTATAAGGTVVGSASIASTASVTATGAVTVVGSASIASTAGVTATGAVVVEGSASIASTAGVTATGAVTVVGSASVTGVSSVAATASGGTFGQAITSRASTWHGMQKVGSNWYIAAPSEGDIKRLAMFKTTDPTANQGEVDSANRPDGNQAPILVCDELLSLDTKVDPTDGTTIHFCLIAGDTGQKIAAYYGTFNTTTDTWGNSGTMELLQDDLTYSGEVVASKTLGAQCAINVKPNGDIMVVTHGAYVTGSRNNAHYYDASATTWTKAFELSTSDMCYPQQQHTQVFDHKFTTMATMQTVNKDRVWYRRAKDDLTTGWDASGFILPVTSVWHINIGVRDRAGSGTTDMLAVSVASQMGGSSDGGLMYTIRLSNSSTAFTPNANEIPVASDTYDVYRAELVACFDDTLNSYFMVYQAGGVNTGLRWCQYHVTNDTWSFAEVDPATSLLARDATYKDGKTYVLIDNGASMYVVAYEPPPSATINSTAQVASSGDITVFGTSPITTAAALTASGDVSGSASATITTAAALTASGDVSGSASATLSASATVASSGTVTSLGVATSTAASSVVATAVGTAPTPTFGDPLSNAYTTWGGGPLKATTGASAGKYFSIAPINGVTINRQYLGMFWSSDLALWSEVDSGNRPDGDMDGAVSLTDGIVCLDARLKADGKTILVGYAATTGYTVTVYEVKFDTDTLAWSTPTIRKSNYIALNSADEAASIATIGMAIGLTYDSLSEDYAIFYQGELTSTFLESTVWYSYYDASLNTWTDNLVLVTENVSGRSKDFYGVTDPNGTGQCYVLYGATHQNRTVGGKLFTFGGTTGTVGAWSGDGYLGATASQGCRHIRGETVRWGLAVGTNNLYTWASDQVDDKIIGTISLGGPANFTPYFWDKTDLVQVKVGVTCYYFYQRVVSGAEAGQGKVQISENGSGEYVDGGHAGEILNSTTGVYFNDAVWDPDNQQVNLLQYDGTTFSVTTWAPPKSSFGATSSATATGKVGLVSNVFATSGLTTTMPGLDGGTAAISASSDINVPGEHFASATISALGLMSATKDANKYTVDVIEGTHCGYGFRKLTPGATFAFKARSPANGLLDIGFDGDDLDEAALLTHAAGGDVFVHTWYDQSGNGVDLTSAIDAEQPKIVDNGAITRDLRGYIQPLWQNSLMNGTLAAAVSNKNSHVHFYHQTNNLEWDDGIKRGLIRLGPDNSHFMLYDTGHKIQVDPQEFVDSKEAHHGSYPFIRSCTLSRKEYPNRTGLWTCIQVVREKVSGVSFTEQTTTQLRVGNNTDLNCYLGELIITPSITDLERRWVYNSMAREYTHHAITYERGGGNPRYALPQKYQWQVDGRNWLASLTEEDFVVPVKRPSWDGTYRSLDELAAIYAVFNVEQSSLSGANTYAVRNEPSRWVLDNGADRGLENGVLPFGDTGDQTYDWINLEHNRNDGRDATTTQPMTMWFKTKLPMADGSNGNPFYKQRGLAYRIAAVILCKGMIDDNAEDHSDNYFADWTIGGHMQAAAPSYYVIRKYLPPAAQNAIDDMFRWKVHRMWGHGDADYGLGNLVCKNLPFLTWAWRLFNDIGDEKYKTYAIESARALLFGSYTGTPTTSDYRNAKGIYCTWGGIMENHNTPDTTYNGRSLAEFARLVPCVHGFPDWDFIRECSDRMADWKLKQFLMDETDYIEGPSGYATRTGGSVRQDQDTGKYRDMHFATWTDAWRAIANVHSPLDEASMASSTVTKFANTSYEEFDTQYLGFSGRYRTDLDSHWPVTEYPDFHPHHRTNMDFWRAENGPLMQLPYHKAHPEFNTDHGNVQDFWSYKSTADNGKQFGWMIESYNDSGGSNGWYNGCLEAFWLEDYGLPFLSRHDGAGSDYDESDRENTRYWPKVREMATTGVYGFGPMTNLTAFNSACMDKSDFEVTPDRLVVTYNLGAPEPNINATMRWGVETGTWAGQEQSSPDPGVLTGDYYLSTTWTAKRNGLKCEYLHTRNSATVDTVSEMWATLPVLLSDPGVHASDAIVEYWDGATWQTLTSAVVDTAELRVRQERGNGYRYCYVDLSANPGGTHRVRYCPDIYVQAYQSDMRLRNIEFDLLGGTPGTNQTLPASISFEYQISTIQTSVPVVATAAVSSVGASASGVYTVNETSKVLADSHAWCIATVTTAGGGYYVYGAAAIASTASVAAVAPPDDSAAINAVAGLTASGGVTKYAVATIYALAGVDGYISDQFVSGSAGLVVVSGVATSGLAILYGNASPNAVANVVSGGVVTTLRSATISSTSGVTASGVSVGDGVTLLSATGSVSVSANVTKWAAGAIDAATTQAATGFVIVTGTVTMSSVSEVKIWIGTPYISYIVPPDVRVVIVPARETRQ